MKPKNKLKKPIKIILIILAITLTIFIGLTIFYFASTFNHNIDENKLVDLTRKVCFYDRNNQLLSEESNNTEVVNLNELPNHVKNAFIAIEDKRFYQHKGIDYKGLFRALVHNLFSFSFKEGASTITQQLVKNTHLSSKKTLKRKLIELKLAKQLENKYSKDEILEKYLNTIYFGENCFGITKASNHYFGKTPSLLSISESSILAGIIKAPSNYSLNKNLDKALSRRNVVLQKMLEQKYINNTEYDLAINEKIVLANSTPKKDYYKYLIDDGLSNFTNNTRFSQGDIRIYTTIDANLQNKLNKIMSENYENYEKSAVILDKNAQVLAYYTTCGNVKRQMGSTIKPLCVYAPAIENDIIHQCTILNDEPTNFNGYNPSNYSNIYYGKISAKTALSKSLNVPTVKILQDLGVKKASECLNNLGISTTKNDNSLTLALGATEYGENLVNITNAYSVFMNEGYYKKYNIINEICTNENKSTYSNPSKKVFNSDTVYIMNDMLKDVVSNGTGKKLKKDKLDLYAKTGTVGTNKGNTDAYTISYNTEYLIGVWLGNKKDNLLPNEITGGNTPATISKKIWDNLYINKEYPNEFAMPNNVEKINLDKISYEQNQTIEIADEIAPKRYVSSFLFKSNNIPSIKSKRFTSPKIEKPELFVNSKGFLVSLCLTEYYDALIFKKENDKKYLVYNTLNNNKETFVDEDITPLSLYEYSVIPYFKNGDDIYYGEEVFLDKVKFQNPEYVDDDYWAIKIIKSQ